MTIQKEAQRQFTADEHDHAMRTMTTAEYAAYIRSERCPAHARHRPLPTPPDDDSLHDEWLREAADEFEYCQRVQALDAWTWAQFG